MGSQGANHSRFARRTARHSAKSLSVRGRNSTLAPPSTRSLLPLRIRPQPRTTNKTYPVLVNKVGGSQSNKLRTIPSRMSDSETKQDSNPKCRMIFTNTAIPPTITSTLPASNPGL